MPLKDPLLKTDGRTAPLCGSFLPVLKPLCTRLKSVAFLLPLMLMVHQCCFAQSDALKQQLLKVKDAADSSVMKNPAEKIYLQLDKHTYTPGDTLWFKAYLFHAPTLGLSARSGIMYLDIATDSNVMVKRLRLPVEQGLSWGNISLKSLPAGNYILKAYTNWMRNFNGAGTFYARFTISDDGGSNWLANYTSTIITANGQNRADIKLLLSDFNKMPVIAKNVQLYINRDKRVLYKKTIETDEHGLIDVNFKLPANVSGLRVAVRDNDGNSVNIPLNIELPGNADLQFMPESGNLVAGLPAHVAFKAIGADGRGIDVTGTVFDRNKQRVADFSSLHLGMGSFNFQVKEGEKYHAIVTLPGGVSKEFALPEVKNSGTILKVNEVAGSDSVNVSAYATADIVNSGNTYFLIGKSRQTICYAATFDFTENGHVSKTLSKKLFPTGVTHFILANAKSETLNERLVFMNQHDGIRLNITNDKIAYIPHDSLAMHVAVSDLLGNPVKSNFSLAVTDDALVHTDPLNNENIFTSIFLTSELKGYIEQPGYYFNLTNKQSKEALDNLMLTQGWVNYDWPAEKSRPIFAAENEFAVKGTVVNVFNRPVKKMKVSLLSSSPLLVSSVLTDDGGNFLFHNFPRIDSPLFVLKTARNFNVSILIKDPSPPEFAAAYAPVPMPWYVSRDTSILAAIKNNRVKQSLADSLPAGQHMLKEVKVTAKKIVKGSQNLNGPGNADMAFDEADVEKAGKQNWLQFLEQNVPGFRVGSIHRPLNIYNLFEIGRYYDFKFSLQDKGSTDLVSGVSMSGDTYNFPWYFIDGKPLKLIVDGISFSQMLKSPNIDEPNFLTLKNYLERYNAEDIKGVEIITSAKYASEYFNRFVTWKYHLNITDIAFVEITTRSGKGPAIQNTPGSYLYKPLALSIPSKFYRPRYLVNDTTKHAPDLRSTIHWEPNIVTGTDGKATISFYTADKPSTYTYILEGTDMDGSVGYLSGKIKVTNNITP